RPASEILEAEDRVQRRWRRRRRGRAEADVVDEPRPRARVDTKHEPQRNVAVVGIEGRPYVVRQAIFQRAELVLGQARQRLTAEVGRADTGGRDRDEQSGMAEKGWVGLIGRHQE